MSDNPTTQGFDINIAGSHAGNPGRYYAPYQKKIKYKAKNDEYLTNAIMDDVLEFVDDVKDKAFFLYYSPYAVHTPINPVDSLLPKYNTKVPWMGQDNKGYATMVENLDRNIGNLVSTLKKNGQYENTLIIFTTDNGGTCKVTEQRPLRAGKGSYYEGGIRVPFFVVWPEKITPGIKSDVSVTNLDIYPTLLEITKTKSTAGYELDGKSITGLLNGDEPEEWMNRELYWHFPIYLQSNTKKGHFRDTKFRTRPGDQQSAKEIGNCTSTLKMAAWNCSI